MPSARLLQAGTWMRFFGTVELLRIPRMARALLQSAARHDISERDGGAHRLYRGSSLQRTPELSCVLKRYLVFSLGIGMSEFQMSHWVFHFSCNFLETPIHLP